MEMNYNNFAELTPILITSIIVCTLVMFYHWITREKNPAPGRLPSVRRMSRVDKEMVEHHIGDITEAMLHHTTAIADHLRLKNIFNDDQREDILKIREDRSKAIKIINILKVINDGKYGLSCALHTAGASSIYNDVFWNTDHKDGLTIRTDVTFVMRSSFLSMIFRGPVKDFSTQLRKWYLESFTSDCAINVSKNKMVKDIYVGLVWKDQFKPRRVVTYHDVIRLLRNDKNLTGRVAVVSGEAGIGKTTFVKKLCYDWAKQWSMLRAFTLVIIVPLRYVSRLRKSETILDAAIQYYSTNYHSWFPCLTSNQVDQIRLFCTTHSETVLYIIDGFDEYDGGNSQIDTLKRESGFDRDFRGALIVTTRPAMTGIAQQRFELRVEGFTPAQIAVFVHKWVDKDSRPVELIRELKEKQRTELARTPLLLQMMCDIWEHASRLPVSKRQLFDEFLRFLKRKIELDERKLKSQDVVLWIAGKVAYKELMCQRGGNLIILSSNFNNSTLSYLLDIGLLSEHNHDPFRTGANGGEEYVTFKHKAFQEYLAAMYAEHQLGSSITSDEIIISTRSQTLEFLEISTFINDKVLTHVNLPGNQDLIMHISIDLMIKVIFIKGNRFTADPDEWCATARLKSFASIHICQNYNIPVDGRGVICYIVICSVDKNTANCLKSWISCNPPVHPSTHIVVNASLVQNSENELALLQSILEVIVKMDTNNSQSSVYLPLHCVSPRLSSHTMKIDFARLVQSIKARDKYVTIKGSDSTDTTIAAEDIQKWLFALSVRLINVKIKSDDVVTMIRSSGELGCNKSLGLISNDLSTEDYEAISRELTQFKLDVIISLFVQPKSDLTNECVKHLIDLMIRLSNYEKTKWLFIEFGSVNNFSRSEYLLIHLFNKVNQIAQTNEMVSINITLENCNLEKRHLEIIYNCITQHNYTLVLKLALNQFSKQDGDHLESRLNQFNNEFRVGSDSEMDPGIWRTISTSNVISTALVSINDEYALSYISTKYLKENMKKHLKIIWDCITIVQLRFRPNIVLKPVY